MTASPTASPAACCLKSATYSARCGAVGLPCSMAAIRAEMAQPYGQMEGRKHTNTQSRT